MKHTLKKLTDTKVSLAISVTADELDTAKQKALHKLAQKVNVAGFRPGKVPAHVAEKNLDPTVVANEAIEYAINAALNQAIEAEDLRVLDRPQVDLGDFKPYESLNFTAEVEVLPPVKLGDYTKLKAKRHVAKVTDADIDEVMDRLRGGHSDTKETDRAAKNGDEAVIDFEGRDEKGELVDGASGKDYPLKLGSGTFIPGFEDGIVGHKAGDVFDLPLTFPADYHSAALKGAKVTFTVTLQKVREVALPELTDEFAKKVGPFETIDQLRDDVRTELTAQKEREADDKYKDDLLGELAEKSDVPVPELLVEDQIKGIQQDLQQNLMYRGLTFDQYVQSQGFTDEADWREKEAQEAAVRRVKSGLVLAELSKVEKVQATTEELEARLAQLKQQYPDPKTQEQLDTPEVRRDVANRLLTEKAIDRLVEINTKK